MKIGLITFHNALNYGAALQTYATQKFLTDMGQECIIIDYVNESREKAYNMKAQIYKQIKQGNYKSALRMTAGSIFMNMRRRNFEKFHTKYYKTTKKKYRTLDEIKSINNDFDYFLVGSDQIWNPKNNGSDMTYLLEFVYDDNKKISYASSFGASKIPDNLIDCYRDNLSKIKHLSTRELLGLEIIKKLTGRDANLVLDPVFLLSKKEWIDLAKKEIPEKDPFIFVYTNRNKQFENMVNSSGLDISGHSIHKINRFLKPSDFLDPKIRVDYYITPEKFVSNILNADLVATASFHCVAFSILLHKKFIVFLTGDEGKDARIINLLKITGLTDRIYKDTMNSADINTEIDYSNVDEKLFDYIQDSKTFLREVFN